MPRRRRVPIGSTDPTRQVGLGRDRDRPSRGFVPNTVPGPDDVWLGSRDPDIDVTARLVGTPTVSPPRPRYSSAERPGAFSLTSYQGHDPYEMTLPIKLDRRGDRSVEKRIRKLEELLERKRWAGRVEPPLVSVFFAGNPHPRFQWRVAEIAERLDRARHDESGEKVVYVADIRLVQHVADKYLTESLQAVLPAGGGRGLRSRRTRVKAGETSLHDVARRVYGDPGRASDIARANPGARLGERLKRGRQLRLPA